MANPEFHEAVAEYASRVHGEVSRLRGLEVGPSWLAPSDAHAAASTSFKGLFATRSFSANQELCTYEGVCLRTVEALRVADKSYLMRLGPQCYVDARSCPLILARYINDCVNPAGFNARFDKIPELQCARVVALRDIRPGEEIFVDYGKWYWAGSAVPPLRLSFSALHSRRGF